MGDKLRCQMASRLNVQSRGIMSKSWHKKYCVFLIEVSGESPQIHVFDKEEHFQKNSRDRKVFFLDGIKKIQYAKDKQFGFDVTTKKDKFCFAADNDYDFRHWVKTLKQNLNVTTILEPDGSVEPEEEESDSHLYMDDNVIYETADVTPMFSVIVDDNEAARRCNLSGSYFLVVNLHNLALVDCSTKKAIYQWPFKYIRRFGKTRTNFQFEAGRRCPSGEGEFSFKTDQGFQIFDTFSRTTQKIRSQGEDLPVNPLRVSGQGSATSEVHGLSQSNTETRVSPKPFERGASEPHQPLSTSQGDRKSVKSAGHIGHIPDKFASELNTVLLHHKDPEHNLTTSAKGAPPAAAAEHVPEDMKPGKKVQEEVKPGKKEKQKSDKKSEKSEKKTKKGKEKKEEKKSDKKKARPTVSLPLENEPLPIHAYEEVDEVTGRRISSAGPEPLYAEAADTSSKKPTPKPKPRGDQTKAVQPNPETVLYSEPQKIKKDAWKQHARADDTEHQHQEDYDAIKVAALSGGVRMSNGGQQEPEADYDYADSRVLTNLDTVDETYDHIGNVNMKLKQAEPENLYGTASGKTISSIRKGMSDVHEYEETVVDSSSKKKAVKAVMNEYEEPSMLVPSVALPSQVADQEEESEYADIKGV